MRGRRLNTEAVTDLLQLLFAALPVIQDGLVKGVLSTAGKELYEGAKSRLKLKDEDVKDEAKVRAALVANPDAHAELTRLVQVYQASNTVSITINAEKVGAGYVAGDQTVNF